MSDSKTGTKLAISNPVNLYAWTNPETGKLETTNLFDMNLKQALEKLKVPERFLIKKEFSFLKM